jgi:AraC-like DNA-binding protein
LLFFKKFGLVFPLILQNYRKKTKPCKTKNINHYRESREVKYYADLLNLTPKYLSKVISSATDGLTPAKWIEQYVTAQAKRLIETQVTPTLQETAYMLGFSEPTSFYRYFKRVTGMTAKEYRNSAVSR